MCDWTWIRLIVISATLLRKRHRRIPRGLILPLARLGRVSLRLTFRPGPLSVVATTDFGGPAASFRAAAARHFEAVLIVNFRRNTLFVSANGSSHTRTQSTAVQWCSICSPADSGNVNYSSRTRLLFQNSDSGPLDSDSALYDLEANVLYVYCFLHFNKLLHQHSVVL